jgi:type IV pilus assembly protein PilO
MAIDAKIIANLTLPQKFLAGVAVAGILVGLYWYLVYRGQQETIGILNQQYQERQAKLNETQAIADTFQNFKDEVEKLGARLSAALQELPNQREIPGILENLNSLGAANGLDVVYVKPNPDATRDFYAEVPISIKVRGSYHQVGMFFDAVSRLPRIINIGRVSLGNASEEADGSVILDINCTATTYRYVEKGG